MRQTFPWVLFAAVIAAAFFMTPIATGQTSTTSVIAGVVTDPSGAVVPKAAVDLTNMDTNSVARQLSNDSGQFVFAGLTPGNYKITVRIEGFRTASIPNVSAEVNKSVNLPSPWRWRATEVVEVTAAFTIQLQTTDAQIGGTPCRRTRSSGFVIAVNATELMNIQPGVVVVARI